MAYEVTLITGDGTGPELAEAARKCIDATGVAINWDLQEAGVDVMERTGTPLPDAGMDSVRRTVKFFRTGSDPSPDLSPILAELLAEGLFKHSLLRCDKEAVGQYGEEDNGNERGHRSEQDGDADQNDGHA